MSVVTGQGDRGETGLATGERVPKSDRRVTALGAADELNAQLGVVKALLADAESAEVIEKVQRALMQIQGITAGFAMDGLNPAHERWLTERIAEMERVQPGMTGFVLYGASAASAALQLARAVARRAEAAFAAAFYPFAPECEQAAAYLNRLSDFLYLWALNTDYIGEIAQAVRESMRAAGPQDARSLSLSDARAAAGAVETRAQTANLPVAVAVCGAQGETLLLHVMDGALPISRDAALAKAYTAAVLRMDTADAQKLTQPGAPFYALETVGGGRLTTIAGGVTLTGGGAVAGGLGVSGGSAAQDAELAEFGRKRLWRGDR